MGKMARLLPPPGCIMIGSVCWLVGSFVHEARCDFLKSKSPVFMTFDTDVQHLYHISVNFSEVKVKVQDQNCRTKIFYL